MDFAQMNERVRRAIARLRENNPMIKKFQGLGAIVLLIVLAASTASAVVRQMSGRWLLNRGPTVDIPVNPGFIPGMGTVNEVAGPHPRALTIPLNRFNEVGGGALFPLPGVTLVQLSTMIDAMGPQSVGMFFGGPKGSRPANFNWCPNLVMGGGVGPACPNGNFNQGIGRPGIVRYTAGPNQYGGTMQLLLIGGGEVSVTVGATGMGGALILHNPFGGGGVSNDQEAGGPYKNTGTVALMAGDITLQTMGVPPGVITMPGPIVNMGPAELNVTTGFPWTTGRVQVTNPTATTIAPPSGTMLTLTGFDSRGMGGGHIVMVSGNATKRTAANNTFMSLDVLDLTLDPAVPAMSTGAFATAAALVVLGAGYFLRRRLA
jgi:hypothetical protein